MFVVVAFLVFPTSLWGAGEGNGEWRLRIYANANEQDVPKYARCLRATTVTGSARDERCRTVIQDCDGEEGGFWTWGRAD
jgi:hypothetical protein